MPKLKNPFNLSDPTSARDITPETSGDAFALTDWNDWRSGIEPYLDGNQHTYRMDLHFDRAVKEGDEVVGFQKGTVRVLYFYSSARTWDGWKKEYWVALRDYIDKERRRTNALSLFFRGKLKRRNV